MSDQRFSLLSKPAILKYFDTGDIVIDPFDPENLGTNSYDVRLGEHIWRETKLANKYIPNVKRRPLYNVYDEERVTTLWKKDHARPAGEVLEINFMRKQIVGIDPDDLIVLIDPGESILAHTQEFIGSLSPFLTTKMFARSSTGRNFLHVCADAGVGDCGFANIWTMEIFNRSCYHTIPLVVGRRYAQMAFFEVESIADEDMYYNKGKYQTSVNLETLKRNWKPEDMLPKMYKDREVKK